MENDRGETTNIADQHPEVVTMLQKEFDAFWADTQSYMINDLDPQEAGEIEDEPCHQLFRQEFGEEAYQSQMDRLNGWRKITKKKGGQPLEDFRAKGK
jgi:hypothetical protein